MATEIRMPRLGHSMTEGTVVAWLAKQGETVRADQIILTIETDKAEYEVEAPADGLLSEPLVVEAATAPVEAVLGWVLEPGEARPSAPAESGDQGTARPAPAPHAAESARRRRRGGSPRSGGSSFPPSPAAVTKASSPRPTSSAQPRRQSRQARLIPANGAAAASASAAASLRSAAPPRAAWPRG